MTSSNWITFDLDKALAGMRVGFELSDPNDISMTGLLGKKHTKTVDGVTTDSYDIEMGIYKLTVNTTGTVLTCTPAYPTTIVGQTMKMLDVSIGSTYGTDQAITRSGGGTATINTIEPRDEFAMSVLGVFLKNVENPEKLDDANKLYYCDAAYAWASVMMVSAANSRNANSTTPGPSTVDVNAGNLQSNTEKLLYNMVEKLTELKTQLAANKTQLTTDLGGIETAVGTIADNFEIPDVGRTITIKASIFNTKYIRLELLSDMCYSDVSVSLNLTVSENGTSATRNVGYVLPKGSVVMVEALDDAVTSITSINSESVRGQGAADPNEYAITT